ncbi:MAG: glycosyltransferase, partial [Patescibacteria group bacterium]
MSADQLPIISVIVPTKNSAATLADCLSSVWAQDYPAKEIIVIDNFSTDGTAEIAKKFADRFQSVGPERCTQRNHGARLAQGEFVLFVDSDMVLAKNILSAGASAFAADDRLVGIIVPEESFGRGFWADCKRLERSFYVGIDWMEAARFFRRSSFDQVGGYDERLVSGEDWDLSQRIAELGRIDRLVQFIRHNEGQPTLWKLLKKKIYYASRMSTYTGKSQH